MITVTCTSLGIRELFTVNRYNIKYSNLFKPQLSSVQDVKTTESFGLQTDNYLHW